MISFFTTYQRLVCRPPQTSQLRKSGSRAQASWLLVNPSLHLCWTLFFLHAPGTAEYRAPSVISSSQRHLDCQHTCPSLCGSAWGSFPGLGVEWLSSLTCSGNTFSALAAWLICGFEGKSCLLTSKHIQWFIVVVRLKAAARAAESASQASL